METPGMKKYDVMFLSGLLRKIDTVKWDVDDLLESGEVYKDFLKKKIPINDPEDFDFFLKSFYVSHMVVGVCRQIDGDKQSDSLLSLLNNIFKNYKKIKKAWFVDKYEKEFKHLKETPDPDFGKNLGEKIFEENFGKLEFVDPCIVCGDIGKLIIHTREITKFRNKRIAHKDKKEQRFDVNFDDLDKAIDLIVNITDKYYLLKN